MEFARWQNNFFQMTGFGLWLNISKQVLLLPLHRYSAMAWPSHSTSHFSFPCAWWYLNNNNVWNVASLQNRILLLLPIEERRAASSWISWSRIPASSVICSGPHLDRIVFWLLAAGPDLWDSSGYVMRTEFKCDCMQRHPFQLLRKTFYLILPIKFVPDHPNISYGSGIWRGRSRLGLLCGLF